MSFFCEWGNAVRILNTEAEQLLAEYKAELNDLEKRKLLKKRFYDIVDTRLFCVVFNCHDNAVRNIIRVTDDAESHLEEFKHEYYMDYNEEPTDRFYFCRGFHRASDFVDCLALANFTIEQFEETFKKIRDEEHQTNKVDNYERV